jgi:hypothetical protein
VRTAAHPSALEAALAVLNRPVPVRTQAQHLRHFAAVQRSQALASLLTVTQTRRWAAKVAAYNSGVRTFYGVPASAETRASVARFAQSCRKRANEACAKARALEAGSVSAVSQKAAA